VAVGRRGGGQNETRQLGRENREVFHLSERRSGKEANGGRSTIQQRGEALQSSQVNARERELLAEKPERDWG